MQKQEIALPTLTLVGLTARTNNKNEMNPEKSIIAALVGTYWGKQLATQIKHRVNPGITYSVYTEFESNEHGDYTYFVGEVVDSMIDQDLSQFKPLTIAENNYQKFTTPAGEMPAVVIAAWQQLWAMQDNDFGGKRNYRADFEIYDQRAADPNNAIVDIYIGIDKV